MPPRALKLLLVGLSLSSTAPLFMLALQHRWWVVTTPYILYCGWAVVYARRVAMTFMDPDQALDQIQAMSRAREAYGDPPEPALAVSIINHMARTGLTGSFVQKLDDEGKMVWVLEVSTSRGSLELRPENRQTWRQFLGNDPVAVDLGLLPPDLPRA